MNACVAFPEGTDVPVEVTYRDDGTMQVAVRDASENLFSSVSDAGTADRVREDLVWDASIFTVEFLHGRPLVRGWDGIPELTEKCSRLYDKLDGRASPRT